MANFTVQFSLNTERFQEDVLDRRFEIGRKIYNSLATVTWKRYKEMLKTKEHRNLISSLSDDKKKSSNVWKQINELKKNTACRNIHFTKM